MNRLIVAVSGLLVGLVGGSGMVACGQEAKQPAAPAPKPPQTPAPASRDTHPHAAPAGKPLDWKSLEAPLLVNHLQLTQREHDSRAPGFIKAGEAYFDHHQPPRYIVFQAIVQPAQGIEPDPFYAMYVARIIRDPGSGRIKGIDEPIRISPEGTANTCGWFHPTLPWRVMFGSTMVRPADEQPAGFQVGTRKYVWMFPKEMDIVFRDIRPVFQEITAPTATELAPTPAGWQGPIAHIIQQPNYDAEGSWSADGRYVLYAHVRDEPTRGRPDADIWIHDTQTRTSRPLVTADGYDGGPFFSRDGRMICYRSDRRGDDLLQLFVAELKFDEAGAPIGIEREVQITDDEHVNWAPYWHPSGRFIVYGSSGVGHSNYEVFAVEVDLDKSATELRKRRITFADGADVLPVFSDDGRYMMWTAQRGPMIAGESRPSSQLWIAEVAQGPGGFNDPDHLFDNLPDQRPEGEAAPAAHPSRPASSAGQ